MFQLDPTQLSDTRKQVHWACQLLSASADAKLTHKDDDSHSNLGWDATTGTLDSWTGIRIIVPSMTLLTLEGASLELGGQTLDAARQWLSEQLKINIRLRDYDMPEHAVATGQPFRFDPSHLSELARWFSFGHEVMQPIAPLRVWPHHFDMGWLIEVDGPDCSIGGGLTPGDQFYAEPYFYVNPYGVGESDTVPDLPVGHWAAAWQGAVLRSTEIIDAKNPSGLSREFFDAAIEISREWLVKNANNG